MSTLPPLFDVVAVGSTNPARLDRYRTAGALGATPWSPNPSWLVWRRPLPGSTPDPTAVEVAGLVVPEGRDAVAAAGRRWSDVAVRAGDPAAVRSLPGDVALVSFRRAATAVVVRSATGLVPLYVHTSPGFVVISTTYTALLPFLAGPPRLDRLVMGCWLSYSAMFPDGRTFLEGVQIVPPGHLAEVAAGEPIRSEPWWHPVPDRVRLISRSGFADAAAALREMVVEAVDDDLDESGGNLLTLSGGVDSSSLAFIAGRHLGKPLAALSLLPPRPGAELDLAWRYLGPLVSGLRIQPHWIEPISTADRSRFARLPHHAAFPVLHPALQLLPGITREHPLRVLVGGEFVDEALGGAPAWHDWRRATSLVDLVRQAHRLPNGAKDLRPWLGAKRRRLLAHPALPLGVGDVVAPAVQEEYGEWRAATIDDLDPAAPWRTTTTLLTGLDGVLPMNWEACSRVGVRRSFPFLRRSITELVLSLHPGDVMGTGKRLFRAALRDLVPSQHLDRPDKGTFGEVDDATVVVSERVRAALNGVLDPSLPESVDRFHEAGIEVCARFVGMCHDPSTLSTAHDAGN